ncbi:hypothetical protein SAMN04515671_1088 [Nakamurella panacisegetis]|uniref:Uncharacterized protein n=1 Tax=Nakamurella panacisegetis TaxID=1090615 RepID=A0A1H0JXQ2_9ACTN|nr:hypothetical protein [Nakamurella panacisegetis]SDO48466.1 hypothetical protein SAMN04515671_1088 [Nakamurella panacisegetis]
MSTVTIPNVELVSIGNWNASKGDGNVTRDDIASMAAAFEDHLVDRPAITIGFGADSPSHDGGPAFGWVERIRVSNDGQTLLGDLVGVPQKLGDAIPTALRRRSIQMSWGARTPAGKVYPAVLMGVTLLGTTAPPITRLSDVAALYSGGVASSASAVFIEQAPNGATMNQPTHTSFAAAPVNHTVVPQYTVYGSDRPVTPEAAAFAAANRAAVEAAAQQAAADRVRVEAGMRGLGLTPASERNRW